MKTLLPLGTLRVWPILVLWICLSAGSLAGQSSEAKEVRTSATLYLWLPSVSGDLKYDIVGGSGTIDAGNILNALEMAFMGTVEVRKNRWSLLTDIIYLDLADSQGGRVNLPGGGAIETSIDMNLSGWQLGFYGGYNLYQTERASLDLMAGARHLSLDTNATLGISGPLPPELPSARLSRSASLWDAVVGLRGRLELGPNWFVPYHADIGTGDSEVTWQAMAGIGYKAGWGDVMLVYRHLEWDQGGDKLIQGLSFSGPGVALKYRF